MITVIITAVLIYIARKLPKKNAVKEKNELTKKLNTMKEESLKYRVPVDEIERVKIEKKIDSIDKVNFTFDAIDFIIFVSAFFITIYISGIKNPKTILVFILNTVLYGAGIFWGICMYYRSRLKKEVTDGIALSKDKKTVYEQMILKNKDYKKLNMCCDIILPAVIIGIPLDNWFEKNFHNFVSVAIMLIIYGIAFILIERRNQEVEPTVTNIEKLPYKTALYIGFFQVLSLFPGTSRSGATIVGGLLNGTSRSVVTEFTFFLGIPVMFGASGIKVLKFILKGNSLDLGQLTLLLVAMIVAFGVSMYVIRFLTDYVKKHDFTVFGKYRIGLGTLLLVYWVFKALFAK